MGDFNKKFAEVMQTIGMQVVDDNSKPMTKDELERYFNEHTIYEIDGKWLPSFRHLRQPKTQT